MAKGKYEYWLTEEGLVQLSGWARDGLTDEQIAVNMGISRDTLYTWKKKYPDISDTLKKSKEIADRQVENALFNRAVGYGFTEEKVETLPDGTQKITQTRKHMPGDVAAQIIWLKNRKPQVWRDKQPEQQAVNEVEDDGFYEAIAAAVQNLGPWGDS